jgi:hypothetical protein
LMRVVAMDRTIVAARIAAMAHGGKCASTGRGAGVAVPVKGKALAAWGLPAPPGLGRWWRSGRPLAPGLASGLGMRRGCGDGAGRWLIG